MIFGDFREWQIFIYIKLGIAGYYSYMWAEVLDADGFEAFKEAGGPFDARVAARLKTLLGAGDTRDPMALYVAFRGRPPSTAALLRGRHLVPA